MKLLTTRRTAMCLALASAALWSTVAMAQATYKVAIAGPMTGGNASFGEQLRRGAQTAVDDINGAGGIKGKKLELVIADDACEPKQAVSVASRLVEQDKVVAVAGHFCSSSTIPASETYAEANILMVTPGSTNPKVTDRKLPTIFRTCGRDDQQGKVAADFIVEKLKGKKVAIIHDKDTYGKGIADATKAVLNQRGVKEVIYEGLTRGEKDFNALVTKIKGAGVDVVYFGGLSSEAGTLVRQLREQGVQATFMSADGIADKAFVTSAGGNANVKGVVMTFGDDPRSNPAGQTVVAGFRKAGFEPEGYTLYAYASIQTIAAALKGSKTTGGADLAKWLKSNTVPTVMGSKAWDANGDLKVADYVVYEWKADGDYAKLKR
ncbi:MAG: branched-chain amino acid ABC transporter substrate-binding protein [Rhodoferax sp.]|nr:branched-chain amino acid ABC transporter substrate-binding protein [Rhodoferax sp.]MDP3654797.1 branched-chain amino acid ABC transporter substrate-binding protein [Rhodoferax sp.]